MCNALIKVIAHAYKKLLQVLLHHKPLISLFKVAEKPAFGSLAWELRLIVLRIGSSFVLGTYD